MKFVKMHGCGNDYVYLDAVTEPRIETLIATAGWADLVRRMSDRHKGIGSDGVIVLCPPSTLGQQQGAQIRMRMFNADSSESEMCGNGVRCVAKFAHDRLDFHSQVKLVETGRGILPIQCTTQNGRVIAASVNMGVPEFDLARVPVLPEHLEYGRAEHGEWTLPITGNRLDVSFVSMGNPHAVWFVENAEREDLASLGPKVENHPAFPNRVNFHVASVRGLRTSSGGWNEVRVRTWERGSGITQACGTGACAVVVAGKRTGRLDGSARIAAILDGGTLFIEPHRTTQISGDPMSGDGWSFGVQMTGPCEDVFEGEWPE